MTGRLRRGVPAVVAVVAMVAFLPGCKVPGQQPGGGYTMTAYFPKAVSLYPKSAVRVLGLSAGTVTAVKIEGTQVEVKMSMAKSIVLPQGVRATIVPQSLLGERYIQLYPAWVQGQARLNTADRSQTVIGQDRTSIPVEPDEALAALKRLLDDLDPSATDRLITNLNTDLSGNGQNLNDALKGLGTLTNTLGDKDKQLGDLIDNFAQFTSTLDTRETQLGTVMDLFAQTTDLLAQERGTIASLIHNLSDTASNALDLVGKHSGDLESDVNTLTQLLQSLDANMGAVSQVLSSGPILVAGQNLDSTSGLIAAYEPAYHRIDLRQQATPLVTQFLTALGLPGFCTGGAGEQCPPGSTGPALTAQSPKAPAPAPNPVAAVTQVVDAIAQQLTQLAGQLTAAVGPQWTALQNGLRQVASLPPNSQQRANAATVMLAFLTTWNQTHQIALDPTTNQKIVTALEQAGGTPPANPAVPLPSAPGLPAAPAVPSGSVPNVPDVAMSPMSPVMALLGSPGATGPIQQSAYGLAPPPAPPHHRGALSSLARWSHSVLEDLW